MLIGSELNKIEMNKSGTCDLMLRSLVNLAAEVKISWNQTVLIDEHAEA